MNFSIQKEATYTYIRVLDEKLDSLIAPCLKSELVMIIKDGVKNILVDLTDCYQCDSSGLSALLLGSRLCSEVNGRFVVCGLTDGVRGKMNLAGTDALLLTAGSRTQAEDIIR